MQSYLSENEFYIEGIKQGKEEVLKIIFNKFQREISTLISRLGASHSDVEDIFMDALESIFLKIRKDSLTLDKCSFKTYLTQVCLFLWFKRFRKKKQEKHVTSVAEKVLYIDEDFAVIMNESLKRKLYKAKFSELGHDCQKVLHMSLYENKNLSEIAIAMNYTVAFAKKKKFICKEKLVEMIKRDPLYQELCH